MTVREKRLLPRALLKINKVVAHIANACDVTDVDTKQSSGVFAYDVHARSAVYEMQFPKACWGKIITISFK